MDKEKKKFKLFDEIMSRSRSDDWDNASLEWELVGLDLVEDWTKCICGHRIKEACLIRNQHTGTKVVVGNCCISKFPGQKNMMNIFRAIKKGRPNEELIAYAYKKGIINYREYDFMKNVWRKRKPTLKQKSWYDHLTRVILNALKYGS